MLTSSVLPSGISSHLTTFSVHHSGITNYRKLRNMSLDKHLMVYHYHHHHRLYNSVRVLASLLGFVTIIFTVWGCQPHAQPPTWWARVPLLVWVITFDLSGKVDPASSYATTGIVLRIIWPRKPHHYVKVGIPSVGILWYNLDIKFMKIRSALLELYFDRCMNWCPMWWPGLKNSPTVTHACRKRRLKWVPSAWGYSWAILPLGVINVEACSSRLGAGHWTNNPAL
jgi:hypothetical protein